MGSGLGAAMGAAVAGGAAAAGSGSGKTVGVGSPACWPACSRMILSMRGVAIYLVATALPPFMPARMSSSAWASWFILLEGVFISL